VALQPILVCMVWRGGERFERCLRSIHAARPFFSRVVLSVTSDPESKDLRRALEAQVADPSIEVLCTNRELPTMQHQEFWIDYLQSTGTNSSEWIYWLAYDDEIRFNGIEALVDKSGNWPLQHGSAYFGPWAIRHEQPDELWRGDPLSPLESWTSFPTDGPRCLPVMEWIAQQFVQPTYMQMSGSVNPLQSFIDLRDAHPPKRGPMRIEMAVAASPGIAFIEEFAEPVSIIYGRSNSDRASYGQAARSEDRHLALRMLRYATHNPRQAPKVVGALARTGTRSALSAVGRSGLPQEEWRVRGVVAP